MELKQCDSDMRIMTMRLLFCYITFVVLLFKFYTNIYPLIDVIKIIEDMSGIQYIRKRVTSSVLNLDVTLLNK